MSKLSPTKTVSNIRHPHQCSGLGSSSARFQSSFGKTKISTPFGTHNISWRRRWCSCSIWLITWTSLITIICIFSHCSIFRWWWKATWWNLIFVKIRSGYWCAHSFWGWVLLLGFPSVQRQNLKISIVRVSKRLKKCLTKKTRTLRIPLSFYFPHSIFSIKDIIVIFEFRF